jgi:hypothetical protein
MIGGHKTHDATTLRFRSCLPRFGWVLTVGEAQAPDGRMSDDLAFYLGYHGNSSAVPSHSSCDVHTYSASFLCMIPVFSGTDLICGEDPSACPPPSPKLLVDRDGRQRECRSLHKVRGTGSLNFAGHLQSDWSTQAPLGLAADQLMLAMGYQPPCWPVSPKTGMGMLAKRRVFLDSRRPRIRQRSSKPGSGCTDGNTEISFSSDRSRPPPSSPAGSSCARKHPVPPGRATRASPTRFSGHSNGGVVPPCPAVTGSPCRGLEVSGELPRRPSRMLPVCFPSFWLCQWRIMFLFPKPLLTGPATPISRVRPVYPPPMRMALMMWP